jgi:hypothetical protein
MPNVTTWVNDELYKKWIDLGSIKQSEIKQKIRQFVLKELEK